MKFGILGPYVIMPGQEHRIRAAKHRALLAILTVNPNGYVPVGRLREELWAGEPPRSADNLLRQYVSAVRRELPGLSISTMPGGYRLELRPGDLDVHEFDQHLGTARDESRRGRPEAAGEALSAALALWRGDPLGDVEPAPSVTAEARRLVERRLAALEQRIDIDLHRGRFDAALDELAALVTLYPEREGLRARQMRALYATGRRADALATYREGREALIEGVGIEPGPQLQQVHRQVLADDLPVPPARPAAHATAAEPARPFPAARPAQLPPDLPDLVGRDEQLAGIVRRLTRPAATAPVMVISGKAGAGKSVLAVRAGHLLRDRFPDGQLFLPVGAAGPEELLRQALRALGAPAAAGLGPRGLRESYAERLRERRVLVVADDAAAERDVRALVPTGSGSALLVTSRSMLPGVEGAHHLVCPPLSETEAEAMLTAIIGERRVRADPDAAHALAHGLGCLPLGLRIAGGRLLMHGRRPVRLLLERLRLHCPLDELTLGELAIRPRLAGSVDRLDDVERRVFRRAAVLRSFDAGTAAAVAEIPAAAAERAVDRLLDLHLIDPVDDEAGPERYAVDVLVRHYAYERLLADEPARLGGRIREYTRTKHHPGGG